MNSLKLLQSRAVIATMLLFSFLALEDHGQVRADEVDVTANVTDSTPPPVCFDETFSVSFQPTVFNNVEIDLDPEFGVFEDETYVQLNIDDGQDQDCVPITGFVTFSESGFEDAQNTPAGFLTSAFECDEVPIGDNGGFFTCATVINAQEVSPVYIDIFVTADPDGAAEGTYVNTISIDLYAND